MVLPMNFVVEKGVKKKSVSSGQLEIITGTRSTLMIFSVPSFSLHSFNGSVKFYFTVLLLIMNLLPGCGPGVVRFWDLGWTYINLLGGVN